MRAVVCGAGIAGLAMAQRLTTLGWEVVIVERAPGPRAQGYLIDFFGPGYDAAEAMGVLPTLRQLGYAVDEVSYVDAAGRPRARMDYAQFARALGGRLFSIMRPDIERVLRASVVRAADLRYGCGIQTIEQTVDGVRVALTDGSHLEADLLVGADGVHSTVRRLVFGPEQRYLRYLGFHTAAYAFDDAAIYREVSGRFRLTDTAGAMMGLYGLRDGTVAAFTVHREADPSLPGDPRAALREAYGSLGWVVPQALRRIPDPAEVYYDQVAQIQMSQWHRGRVVLVGDACHAVSLLAGQGASLAVAGAYVLGAQLATGDSIDAALRRYQQIWEPVAAEKQRVARRSTEWFLPSTLGRVWLRRLALAATRLPGVDRRIGSALVGKSNLTLSDVQGLDDLSSVPAISHPH